MRTDNYPLHVTGFPIDRSPADLSKIVDDPNELGQIISNKVIVGFNEGVTPDRIREIVKEIDGEVMSVRFYGDLNGVYGIKIPDTGDATGVYNVIEILEKFPEVEFAGPNAIVTTGGIQ